MSKEKRMVGDYEVLHDIRIRGRNIIVGENPKADAGERYVLATGESFDILIRYTDCLVSDDYTEIMKLFGERVSAFADELTAEHAKLVEQGIPVEVVPESDYDSVSRSQNIEGKIVVIDPNALSPEYQHQTHQIYLCDGGFGAYGSSRGSACYCTNLFTGKTTRYERGDIAGVVSEEKLPEWAKSGLERIQAEKKAKSAEAR